MLTTRAGFCSGTTARARRFQSPLPEFLRTESGGAAVLVAATAAALGGMVAAVAIYLASAPRPPEGWSIAMSTDTAFALALLTLIGPAGS